MNRLETVEPTAPDKAWPMGGNLYSSNGTIVLDIEERVIRFTGSRENVSSNE